jgi:hypothetical protein
MEIPLGAMGFLGWALSKKTTPTNGNGSPGDSSADTPSPDANGDSATSTPDHHGSPETGSGSSSADASGSEG